MRTVTSHLTQTGNARTWCGYVYRSGPMAANNGLATFRTDNGFVVATDDEKVAACKRCHKALARAKRET